MVRVQTRSLGYNLLVKYYGRLPYNEEEEEEDMYPSDEYGLGDDYGSSTAGPHERDNHPRQPPISRLPVELLQEIFRIAVQPQQILRSETMKSEAWTLSHVSRGWYNAALSATFLWGQISVCLWKKHTWAEQMVHTLLERSRGTPLYISIDSLFDRVHKNSIIDALITESERWRMVAVKGDCTLVKALNFASNSTPRLRYLELDVLPVIRRPSADIPDEVQIHTFRNAPQLVEVVMKTSRSSTVNIPWSQIVSFRHDEGGFARVHRALVATASLASLDLRAFDLRDSDPVPQCTLSNLQSLRISFKDQAIAHGLFERLTLPSLKSLSLFKAPPGLLESFMTMTARLSHASRLERLFIHDYVFQPTEFVSLVLTSPRLTSLRTVFPPYEDFLLLVHRGTAFAPRLEKFILDIDEENLKERVPSIHSLATHRCELDVDSEVPANSTLMKYFQINFNSWRTCAQGQEFLEILTNPHKKTFPGSKSEKLVPLMARILQEEIRDLSTSPLSEVARPGDWDLVRLAFNKFEYYLARGEIDIGLVLELFQAFGVHTELYRVATANGVHPAVHKHKLRQRARATLEQLVVYVSQHDPFRTSPDALQMFFGERWKGLEVPPVKFDFSIPLSMLATPKPASTGKLVAMSFVSFIVLATLFRI
ncbi:hypothetical protein NLJ89_g6248 [Agrocybe chaxingu]|uniref:F-box domain-containing protein n=1 Tax=Agrocybe chaxingu TaxID=84603 RepID=A0A9W8JZL9_9AGAR|nr:hypothetical protein NLJ89_g6248 [Agrocybe chaxingu]